MALSELAQQSLRDELARTVTGQVIGSGDPGYDQARRVWNGAVDRRPLAVVRCAGAPDVAAAVRAAVRHELPLAVRGGGHGLPGYGTCEGGIVADLSPLRTVAVDPAARTAQAGGGCTWRDYDAATSAAGLASTGGLISSTGVGGLTLGGGIGWLTRPFGLACDNLLSAEVVTADGDLVRVDASHNADLFWALRGGGGNFGAVTQFEFRVHPVQMVTAGLLLWPAAAAGEIAHAYREWAAGLPDEFTTLLALTTGPDEEGLPPQVRGQLAVAVLGCHTGPEHQAEASLASLRKLGPAADLFGRMPYRDLQQMLDAEMPAGDRYYFTGGFTDGLPDGLIEALRRAALERPSARCELHMHHMGGAVNRVPDEGSAYSGRTAAFTFNILAGWQDPAQDEEHRAWARAARAALAPFCIDGGYPNFATDEATAADVRGTYGLDRFSRLRAVKAHWDPGNVFRLNHNIAP